MSQVGAGRMLQARGITGIILAPPYHGNCSLEMDCRAYSAVGLGYGWEAQELNRVVYDNLQNFITAFNRYRHRTRGRKQKRPAPKCRAFVNLSERKVR